MALAWVSGGVESGFVESTNDNVKPFQVTEEGIVTLVVIAFLNPRVTTKTLLSPAPGVNDRVADVPDVEFT
jgi:hypothetical protein